MRSPAPLRVVPLSTILFCAAALVQSGCCVSGHCGTLAPPQTNVNEPPPPLREFRAAWVTTWYNIDWPSEPRLSSQDQQKEIDEIIERAKALKLNAIILQVRSAANAIYPSDREPWSLALTGTRGKAPDPFYDPLKMWIDKCHREGIELHAWMVPFVAWRDRVPLDGKRPIPTTLPYSRSVWFDPGDAETQDYIVGIYMDVLKRYDIDALHFDHFFYPYVNTKKTGPVPFPDDKTYEKYKQGGGQLSRGDWRRDNINRFVQRLYQEIKSRKKWVKLGISPFGIPRPGMPSYAEGSDQYVKYFADPPLWLRNGWCDYMIPELYWKTVALHQPFLGLLQWWVDPAHNPRNRRVFAGLFTSQINWSPASWDPDEIAGQVMIARLTPGASGHAHFSMRALTQNRKGIGDLLKNGVYGEAALVPTMPWLGRTPPPAPTQLSASRLSPAEVQAASPKRTRVERQDAAPAIKPGTTQPFLPLTPEPLKEAKVQQKQSGFRLTWKGTSSEPAVRVWAVYARRGEQWAMQVVPGPSTEAVVADDPTAGPAVAVAVSAVDRLGNESSRAMLDLTGKN